MTEVQSAASGPFLVVTSDTPKPPSPADFANHHKPAPADVRPPSWNLGESGNGWYITTHARSRAVLKGFTEQQILDVVTNPAVRYPRRDGQVRYIGTPKGSPALCVVVSEHPDYRLVVTVHHHKVETDAWDYQREGGR